MIDNAIQEQLNRIETMSVIAAKNVLTLEEAAIVMGLKKETVRRMMQKHTLPYYKPNANLVYFKKSDVEAWMLQNRMNTKQEAEAQVRAADSVKATKYYYTHKRAQQCSR